MQGQGHTPIWIYIPIVALIAWRLYGRVRRSIGRQPLSRVRPWITTMVFPLLTALLAFSALVAPHSDPLAIYALLAGAAVGIGLGIYGHRLTQFEATPAGLFYTPNAHLGIALTLVMVIRLGYRFLLGGYGPTPPGSPPPPPTPGTLIIFGALAGYYTTYAIGLILWRRKVALAAPAPSQPQM